jgi:hypothetical protein
MELLAGFKLEACAADDETRPLLCTLAVQPFPFNEEDHKRLEKLVDSPTAKKHMRSVNAIAMTADGFVAALVPCVLEPQDVGPINGRPFVAMSTKALAHVRRFQRHNEVLKFTLAQQSVIVDAWTTIKRFEDDDHAGRSFPDLINVVSTTLKSYVDQRYTRERTTSEEVMEPPSLRQRAHTTLAAENLARVGKLFRPVSRNGLVSYVGNALEAAIFTISYVNSTKRVEYEGVDAKPRTGLIPVPPVALVMPMHTVYPGGEKDALDTLLPADFAEGLPAEAPRVVHNAQVGRPRTKKTKAQPVLAAS